MVTVALPIWTTATTFKIVDIVVLTIGWRPLSSSLLTRCAAATAAHSNQALEPGQVTAYKRFQHGEAVAQDTDVDFHGGPDGGGPLGVGHIWVVKHGADVGDTDAGGDNGAKNWI